LRLQKPPKTEIQKALRNITSASQKERVRAYNLLDDWLNSLDADIPENYGKLTSIFASIEATNAVQALIESLEKDSAGIALILELLYDVAENMKLNPETTNTLYFALEARQLIREAEPVFTGFLQHHDAQVREMTRYLLDSLT
jgi:hypothetical protein